MDKTVLIDADAIVYSAGWAGCRRYYVYCGKEYQYKKELPPGYDEGDLHLVVEPEELRNTYSNVRKAMDTHFFLRCQVKHCTSSAVLPDS